jgi:hypothetical protein
VRIICDNVGMVREPGLFKKTDFEGRFHCAGGTGIIREEVWVDYSDKVARYNLAFILPHLSMVDRGRVLGFDNAHGVHERHFMGKVQAVDFNGYQATAERFYREVEAIRRGYEDQDFC